MGSDLLDDDIIKEFLLEAFEKIESLEEDLLTLEKDPNNKDVVNRAFRSIHTVKGNSGTLGFPKLESVCHTGETVLDRIRATKLQLSSEIVTALLNQVDAMKQILETIQSDGSEGNGNYQALIDELSRLGSV